MAPDGTRGVALLFLAIPVALAVVIAALLLLRGRRARRVTRRPVPAFTTATAVIGALLVGVVGFCEVSQWQGTGGLGGDPTWTRVESASPAGAPDRLQLVVAALDEPGLAPPRALYEVVQPLPRLPSVHPIDVEIDELGLELSLTFRGRGLSGLTKLVGRQGRWFSSYAEREIASVLPSLDAGDGRPFSVVSQRFVPVFSYPLALLGREGADLLVLARPLHPGDEVVAAPASELAATIGRTARDGRFAWRGLRSVEATDGVALLASRFHPLGALVLVVGLLLLCWGRLSMVQTVAVLLVVPLLLASVASRVELAGAEGRLQSPDADARVAAAGTLTRGMLFPDRVGSSLAGQFRQEADPQVRAALLLALASAPENLLQTDSVQELLEEALDDPAAEVRAAARRIPESTSSQESTEESSRSH